MKLSDKEIKMLMYKPATPYKNVRKWSLLPPCLGELDWSLKILFTQKSFVNHGVSKKFL